MMNSIGGNGLRENNSFVISIAAVSGGGKTTIAKHLHDTLKQSKVFYFDDYDFNGPDDIIAWVDRGANYDEWDLTPLLNDIEKLLDMSPNYIILDYPFAYNNHRLGKYIDLSVFIDTPLDIAMARRVYRDFSNSDPKDILNDMDFYIAKGRKGYIEMLKSIKPTSDLIVDGALSISEIVEKVSETITRGN